MAHTTRPIDPTLTWEEYCAEVGVDPHEVRRATVTRALHGYISALDAALRPARVPTFDSSEVRGERRCDAEPSGPTPD